ncbi:hypothetical protein T09_15022 [Trichinella sp. T9]|nr:hypothetical protein T09_15022 [Trichinella sp. T9]
MLMATAFLPLNEVPKDVDLLCRDVTGSVAALFEYFREEWMTPNRMPLWNVYHVINRQAGKRHLTFYELLRLLIDEQGSTETVWENRNHKNLIRLIRSVSVERRRLIFNTDVEYSDITPGRGKSIIDHKAAILVVNLNPESIICDFETALIPAIQGYFPNTRVQGCYFQFFQAVHWKVSELGLKTQYRQHEKTRRKIRMLLATAFLPVPQVDTRVSVLEAGTTGNLSALFQYFRQEGMTDERLPLWNVYNVNIRTNNHLEGWHNRLNRKRLLISEQGVMDTLIQQVLSGNVTVGDLRRVNKVYAQKQRQIAQYTVNTPTVGERWSSS